MYRQPCVTLWVLQALRDSVKFTQLLTENTIIVHLKSHEYTPLQNNFLRWGTSPTCVTCALCPQTRRKHLLRRTTWVSSRPRRWTPRTWRQPFTIFLQVTIIFHFTSTAFPFLSLPMTDNRITSLLWVITNQNNQVCCNFPHMSEIHRIVSQKSALSPGEEDVIRPANLETINVKPTVNTEAVRRQCCSS